MIAIMEINETARLKNAAVKNQDFKLALELRQKEAEMESKLISLQDIKEIRKQIAQ